MDLPWENLGESATEKRMNSSTAKASKYEFNLCPMCWMPLNVDGAKSEDALWQLVQLVFKGKPAFSIEADGYKHERPVLVFGVSPLHPDAKSNVEECHFIHNSVYADSARVSNNWLTEIIPNTPKKMSNKLDLRLFLGRAGYREPDKFVEMTNIKDGLLTGVFEFVPADVDESMLRFGSSLVVSLIAKTFPGCRDCNQKMTVSKLIEPLFMCLIPMQDTQEVARRPRAIKRKLVVRKFVPEKGVKIPNETMLYYIMLGGMLDKNDIITETPDSYCYTIVDRDRCLSWKFRFVLLWCLIQILFSVWEGETIGKVFKHHISYVYSGIQDFYLSFLFFALHCANGRSNVPVVDTPLDFDAFHFFYSTHLPFFLIKGGVNGRNIVSLSECILQGIQFIRPEYTDKEGIRRQFDSLKGAVLSFWNRHFKPLSDFIHGGHDSMYSAYFCSPERAMLLRNGNEDDGKKLDVETFSHYFTNEPGYWFHFKYITMVKIERDCKLYCEQYSNMPLVQQVWKQWYGCLCTCIQRLGLRRAGVNAQFHGVVNLSLVLRALYPGARWRMIAE